MTTMRQDFQRLREAELDFVTKFTAALFIVTMRGYMRVRIWTARWFGW